MNPLQPVIVAAGTNHASVARLVDYCAKLDGTQVKVVQVTKAMDDQFRPLYPEAARECRAAFSLHVAAKSMVGQPFIWLEHDSIPLRAGWASLLTEAYAKAGKPYLLSSDSHPPHDLVGGIGVYGPDTAWQIPQHFKPDVVPVPRGIGWDLWMWRNLRSLIATTPLIQHSYGHYNHDSICVRTHSFPRDAHLLRKEAVVFHRCIDGTLFDPANRMPAQTFFHSGDLGDTIYQIDVMRSMSGGTLMLGPQMGLTKFKSRTREPMTQAKVDLLLPLLLAQPWCKAVEFWPDQPKPEWINLNGWRETYRGCNHEAYPASLWRYPMRHFGCSVQDETQPWLQVLHEGEPAGLVVARSPRYHNDTFPWKELVARYRNRIRFVGLPSEHQAFTALVGHVQYVPTGNLLELAQVIASGAVFVGNQSCPYAIAEALKRPCIQETWPAEPNCLFERPGQLAQCVDLDRIVEFVEGYL